jgi:phage tail-like protein
MPARIDPYAKFNFIVEIDGLTVAGFSEVSGIGVEVTPIEYREGSDKANNVRKLPGLTKYPNIVLKRGVTHSHELWDWLHGAVEGQVARRNGAIILLDASRTEVLRFNFFEGWVCNYEGPSLNATANEIAIETVEICHERIELG